MMIARRAVLRLLAAALLPGALERAAVAAAQAPARPAPAKWIPAEASTPGTPGVTAREIRLGMSAAFKGTAAGLGTEFYRGAQAYYDEVNARGGVYGRAPAVNALVA